MKIKDGLLTLVIAAALGSTGAYAQSSTTEGVTPGDTSLPDPTQPDQQASTAPPPSSSSEMEMEQRVETGAAISPDERARAGGMSSSMDYQQAQSDVPPPVDSETVRQIQQALSDQGHEVEVDGIWGDKTHAALREFQSDEHLNATGQLDGETFAALGLADASQQTASISDQSQQGQDALTEQQEETEQQQAAIESSPAGTPPQPSSSQ